MQDKAAPGLGRTAQNRANAPSKISAPQAPVPQAPALPSAPAAQMPKQPSVIRTPAAKPMPALNQGIRNQSPNQGGTVGGQLNMQPLGSPISQPSQGMVGQGSAPGIVAPQGMQPPMNAAGMAPDSSGTGLLSRFTNRLNNSGGERAF